MKYLVAAALTLIAAPAFAAEPDICYANEPPVDAIVTAHKNASPFTKMDTTLSSLYLPRALCGLDVKKDLAFWRSYYSAFGCSPDSEIAQLMEGWLTEAPSAMEADFAAAKKQAPERVAALCQRVSDCVVPESYDIEGETGLYCPSLGG
jgi:hypothetical protein